jgi:DNA polymerase type B, organellar and viral
MTKFQIYSHYKLPITLDPLKYGKLLEQINNKFIVQLTTKNVAIINQNEKENFVKIFKNGDLILEFTDKTVQENSFIRSINDTRFLFENEKLISTQISNALGLISIFESNYPIYFNYDPVLNINLIFKHLYLFYWRIKINFWGVSSFTEWLAYTYFSFFMFILPCIFIFLLFKLIFANLFPSQQMEVIMSFIPCIKNYSMKGNTIKLRKTRSSNIWNVLEFKINNMVFTKELFQSKLNLFWNNPKVNIQFNLNNHMFVLFKIKYKNSDFVTIGKLQRLNIDDKDWFFNWILNMMEFKSEYYNETQIESIIFSFGFKEGKAPKKLTFKENLNYQVYQNNKLPISYNPLDCGKLLRKFNYDNYTQFILQTKDGNLIIFKQFKEYNEVEIFNKGDIMVSYKDELINDNKFFRIIDNKKYLFENNHEILFMKENKVKFISKISTSKNMTNNFLILDIETYIKNGILIPFCISIYDGINVNYFYILDYKNSEDMIISALNSIMIRKYNNYKVYVHNLAKFDIIFLLKYLVKLGTVDPIIHNNRIISVNFSFDKNNYQLIFRDSYLLLLDSLKNLSNSFNVETQKSIFPFLFVNENNFDYEGKVPDIKYFGNKITLEEYNNYSKKFNNNWNLREETIKYCNIDCISLYQVIIKFNNLIFGLFKINIHKYPTLPSLAFAIYRSNFMMDSIIPQLSGKIANAIRSSYTGGAVDMYVPKPPKGKKVYCYDVNALYPSQMKTNLMPVGTPIYFKGNIRDFNKNAFGFFYCKIKAPDKLEHPILQTHVKTNNGTRTVAPLGQWEDMIFSPEMDNAINHGYNFEILWGYTFESAYIFEEYVNFFHNLRNEYPKGHPMNYIAKILLNSLYGRFGMDDNFPNINIIHKDYYPDFENKYFDNIIDCKKIGDYFLVKYKTKEIKIQEEDSSTHNISIGISSAITAYSRIHMTIFKNNPDFTLYYTDTDSAYFDKPLPKEMVDSKILGKLKLEHICNKAIFLSPKVYALETENREFIYKVKGLSHEVELSMKDFEQLLYKDAFIEKTQTKWIRKLSEAHIELLEQVYTLEVTDNKRELIYDKNNKLIGTKPYKISESKDIREILTPFTNFILN